LTQIKFFVKKIWLFSTLCDNFCLGNTEVLIGQDF